MVLEADLGGDQAERGGEAVGCGQRSGVGGQLRRVELRVRGHAGPQAHADADDADLLLQHDQRVAGCRGPGRAQLGQQRAGSDGGMTGEGKLGRGREDAHARGVRGILRLQDEGGLRQVELARDRLHAAGIQAVRVEHDGERIAAEALAGEHVEDMIGEGHRRARSLAWPKHGAHSAGFIAAFQVPVGVRPLASPLQ